MRISLGTVVAFGCRGVLRRVCVFIFLLMKIYLICFGNSLMMQLFGNDKGKGFNQFVIELEN